MDFPEASAVGASVSHTSPWRRQEDFLEAFAASAPISHASSACLIDFPEAFAVEALVNPYTVPTHTHKTATPMNMHVQTWLHMCAPTWQPHAGPGSRPLMERQPRDPRVTTFDGQAAM